MDQLLSENADRAHRLLGEPSLSRASLTGPGAELRRSIICRALYPQKAPPSLAEENANPTKDVDQDHVHKALMVVVGPEKASGTPPSLRADVFNSASVGKRAREGMTEDRIISVPPEALKQRHALTASATAAHEAQRSVYAPPTRWKMWKVLVGHQGWVWTAAVDPTNSWFATGGFDAVIKVWCVSSGALKLNLTGHKEAVRSIALSTLSPYLFSGSDDRSVKCWDLERNEIIRDFFGHKSAVHCVAAHPTLDVIVSGGRDKTIRVWDIRTRAAVHTLTGHTDCVMSLVTQQADPQIVSGGNDGLIYMWDMAAGKAMKRLTRHKKPVRGLTLNTAGSMLISCGADDIRVWKMPNGEYVGNVSTTVDGCNPSSSSDTNAEAYRWSCCAMSPRNVLAVGSQDGHLALYDWNRPQPPAPTPPHYTPFQLTKTKSIPGTLVGEGGINYVAYDASGTRMITCESDKSIKMWRQKE